MLRRAPISESETLSEHGANNLKPGLEDFVAAGDHAGERAFDPVRGLDADEVKWFAVRAYEANAREARRAPRGKAEVGAVAIGACGCFADDRAQALAIDDAQEELRVADRIRSGEKGDAPSKKWLARLEHSRLGFP
jgi:hypothetical protein